MKAKRLLSPQLGREKNTGTSRLMSRSAPTIVKRQLKRSPTEGRCACSIKVKSTVMRDRTLLKLVND